MNEVGFSEAFRADLARESGLTDTAIDAILQEYEVWRLTVDGAPPPDELTEAHVFAVLERQDRISDEDWPSFVGRILRERERSAAALSPFMPAWISKTPDRAKPFVSDTLADPTGVAVLTDTAQGMLDQMFRSVAPQGHDNIIKSLNNGPPVPRLVMEDVLEAVKGVLPVFVKQLGTGDEPGWRWSVAVPVLAGFGYLGFRRLATVLEQHEDHWDYFATLGREDWVKQVAACRDISGYPVGLLRLDFLDALSTCRRAIGSAPVWLKMVAVLHLLKHVRYFQDEEGLKLYATYKGEHATVLVQPDGKEQSLLTSINKVAAKTLCDVLRLPMTSPTARNRDSFHDTTDDALSVLHPTSFVRQRPLMERPDFVTPGGVRIIQTPSITKTAEWINTGLSARNVATVNTTTGKVCKDDSVHGLPILTYSWPRKPVDENQLLNWKTMLPEVVLSSPPSALITQMVKNVNFLGHERAWRALIDTVLLLDLCRGELSGSRIGTMLPREFPILGVYPMGGTMAEATNQGKTNLAFLMSRVMCPELPSVTMLTRSASAPSQRAVYAPIEQYGTASYDEFIVPKAMDHFLNKEGLQILCTGGSSSPGQVMGNAMGKGLRHPITFASKVSAFPPDLRNRQVASFMDCLTTGTRCTDEELGILLTAAAPFGIRLAALRWMADTNFVARVRNLVPMGGDGAWRFNAHLAVANMLVTERGGSLEELRAFFADADRQCDLQLDAAEASGMADELGLNGGFSFEYYWEHAKQETLMFLVADCERDRGLKPIDALRVIVEDFGTRKLENVLRSYGLKERGASQIVIKELAKPWVRDGVSMRVVVKRDAKGRDRKLIEVIEVKEAS